MKNKIISIAILLLLIFFITGFARANSFPQQEAEQSIKKAINYLHNMQNEDGGFPAKKGYPSNLDVTTWVIMALRAAGEDVTGEKWAPSGQNPVGYMENCGDTPQSTTDYARILLALTAAGEGTVYKGVDLTEKMASFQMESGQFGQSDLSEKGLINCHMWSVLALCSSGQDIPAQEQARNWLLSRQNEDGGFGWADGVGSDPDDTGVALQALVQLGEDPNSSPTVKKALQYLKKHQGEDGGFNWDSKESNVASDAWVLQGLFAAGEDPTGDEWSVRKNNAITHLLSLQDSDGSFIWKRGVKSSPVMMTAYAVMALAQKPVPVNLNNRKVGVSSNDTFSDIPSDHWAFDSIMELVRAKVLAGFPDGTFRPEGRVTRAEFAKFMVYGLGLQGGDSDAARGFKDVPGDYWARGVISTAVDKGYIKGKPGGIFDPKGEITGAELAAMLVRALPDDKKTPVESGPHWYSASVSLARKNQLLYPGFEAGIGVTRAQCAYSISVLKNLLDIK